MGHGGPNGLPRGVEMWFSRRVTPLPVKDRLQSAVTLETPWAGEAIASPVPEKHYLQTGCDALLLVHIGLVTQ